MPAPPDFRLYHGNHLDLLAELLASQLALPEPGAPVLEPDTILIPQPAMRRWLQKTLAEKHGIAANLRFLTPGEFVSQALAANLAGSDATLANADTLRWRLWALLADQAAMQAPVFAPLQPVLAGPDRALAAWSLAGEVANAFEKYQAWRRGWLLRWDGGADPDDWQAELWRRATRGQPHRARRLDAYLQRFDGPAAVAPAGLPSRLFAFACQNVSPDVLRVIASAALSGPLHFFFVSPVNGWWGDLLGARERLRADLAGVFAQDADHPLLVANGAAGRDFVNLLFAGDVVQPSGEFTAYAEPDKDGLLQALQRDLLARRAPPAAPVRAFNPADRSLQLHACHTPLREVQVLHDQLRALLDADPELQPRDIAVLTPDVDAYAPLVHAVFGAAMNTPRALPYAVADGSALAGQSLADWFLRVLGLPGARFTLAEGLSLLSPAPVAQRLGLTPALIDRLGEALAEAGARWGRDAAHRVASGAPDENAYTWQWAIDRLLLGHASADEGDIEGVAPLLRLEGGDLAALNGLLSGLRALERLARDLATPRAPLHWPRLLAAALDDLLPDRPQDPADARAIEALRAHVGALSEQLVAAELDAPMPSTVVRAWLQARLSESDDRQPFLSGGVTFGRMVPMRLIPFKVICLLGMSDGDYPRRDPGGALNRLTAALGTPRRQVGDRSVREDDRFLFLQLLASAGQVFYLSFVGSDPRSGDAKPPSVVVSELMDVAARYFADAGDAAGRLLVRHPLQPFAPQAFGAVADAREAPADAARRIGFHGAWRPAAEAAGGQRQPLPPFVPKVLPVPPAAEGVPELSRAALFSALANPARHFLTQRLALRLPRPEDELPDSEPFDSADSRLRHRLGQQVFEALRAGDVDDATLQARLLSQALLAPGPAGRETLREVRGLVGGAARSARDWAPDAAQPMPWRLALPGRDLVGSFANVHARGLLQFRPGKAHGRVVLDLGLDWLVWSALGETRPVRRLLAGEPPHEFAPLPQAQAIARLADLAALADQAAQQALPFLPKSGWVWFQHASSDKPEKSEPAARAQWCGSGNGFAGEGDDPWVKLALRGQDPFVDEDAGALQHFDELSDRIFRGLPAGASLEAGDD